MAAKRKVTIKEIAKELKVSIATVSRAVNPETRHLVSKPTLKKVLSIIRKEGYIPSQPARRLVTGKSYNIVIFFKPEFRSAFYNDYYSKMVAGAIMGLKGTSYNLLLSVIQEESGGFDVPHAIRGLDVAGAVICNFMGVTKVSAKNIFNIDVPVIIINQHSREKNPNCFLIDNFKGALDAANYLIKKGHTRIGFIRGVAGVKDGEDRERGYRKALELNDIPYRADLTFQGDFVEKSGKAAADYYFKSGIKAPTAIFTANDLMAVGLIKGLADIGINCPKDVSVIGFDGIDSGKYTSPALTTVRQPIYEMSCAAVQEVLSAIENDKPYGGTKYFNTKIIERGSVIPFTESTMYNKGGNHVFRKGERDTAGADRR